MFDPVPIVRNPTPSELRARLLREQRIGGATGSAGWLYDRQEITIKNALHAKCRSCVFDTTQDQPCVAQYVRL
ncbi:MAG: hypothetical protein CTY20_03130 [Hyphomicrobium sp.]|nr:MAG: hypothetical protein CTY20_03130 [Hyphomicrobium sp.]